MPIQDRKLEVGTRLVGTYKKEEHVCTVEADDEGKPAYVLADGRRFTSLSSAAGSVMGGKSVNGWLFWSRARESTAEPELHERERKSKRLIYKLPNQSGMAAGKSRWFCNACMKSFITDTDEEPQACPEGHAVATG